MTDLHDANWITVEASVTSCRYQSPGLGTLAWGFSTRQKFRISFDYHAQGRLYSDEFQSPVAIPQNERISIAYNPLHPEQNSSTRGEPTSQAPALPSLIAIGITGSIVLSLVWLAILRGCH